MYFLQTFTYGIEQKEVLYDIKSYKNKKDILGLKSRHFRSKIVLFFCAEKSFNIKSLLFLSLKNSKKFPSYF